MDPASAAASGNLILFALVVAGALIVVLGGVMVWLFKDRARSNQDRWTLLEKRLSGGSDAMSAIKDTIEDLRRELVDLAGRTVTESDCRHCQNNAAQGLKEIEQRVTRWESSHANLERDLSGLADRVDQGFKTLTGLLGQIVTVPRAREEDPARG